MKKLILLGLVVLLLAGSTALATTYSHTVSGKIYTLGTTGGTSGAVVTLTIHWSGTPKTSQTTSANDGSYSITVSSNSKIAGQKMSLLAVKNNVQGATGRWTSGASPETKSITMKNFSLIHQDLRFSMSPENWDPTVSLDPQMEPSAVFLYSGPDYAGDPEIQGFNVQLAYDPSKLQTDDTVILPMQGYGSFVATVNPVAGAVEVEANMPGGTGLPIGDEETPTELFSVQWTVVGGTGDAEVTSVKNKLPDANSLFINWPSLTSMMPLYGRTDYMIGTPKKCQAHFMLDTYDDFQKLLNSEWPDVAIRPTYQCNWDDKISDWLDFGNVEGEPYPDNEFMPAELWVYEGNSVGSSEPNDAGLVMYWGDETLPDGNYSTAWNFDYGLDPDLRNSTIQITITAPQFGLSGPPQVTAVSFAINDAAGLRRWWWWSVGSPPAAIQWNTPTTVTINTAIAGAAAATPMATGYVSNPGFNLATAQSFDVDENFQWIFGAVTVPPPGQPQFVGMWNYWHNLLVTKNVSTGVNKGYHVKWSQPPDANESFDPPHINGWDEWSDYNTPPMMADDWQCRDDRPITDIHWWGSFKGWKLRKPPAILPKAFHIGIWTDVALGDPCNLLGFSHPGTLIWENFCDSYAWNFAGVDVDPQGRAEYEDEMCFQFNQLLNEDEWFYQTPNDVNVYWLSVSSIYDPCDRESPDFHEWGWKTRPHIYNDDAVQTLNMVDGTWPPKIGSVWGGGAPVEYPPGTSWDLAFELTTNEGPPSADLRRDGIVDLRDLAVLANQWLTTTIP